MVCKVAISVSVGYSIIVNAYSVGVKRVCNRYIELSGIAFLSVSGCVCKNDLGIVIALYFPDLTIKALFSAVQMVFMVICVKCVCNSVESELSVLDTVAVSSDKRTLICCIGKYALKSIIAAHNINSVTLKNSDSTAEIKYLSLHLAV